MHGPPERRPAREHPARLFRRLHPRGDRGQPEVPRGYGEELGAARSREPQTLSGSGMKYQGERLQTLLAGEYALGLLTGAARRRFERLLMESPALRAELTLWEERFAALNLKLKPVEPPGYLWWRLLGRVRAEAQPRREAARNTFWRSWAVAATVVLAVLVVAERVLPPAEQKPAEFALVSDAKG